METQYHLKTSIDSNGRDAESPLRQESEKLLEDEEHTFRSKRHNYGIRNNLHISILYITIAGLFLALVVSTAINRQNDDPSQQVWSPAQDVIEYQVKDFDLWFIEKSPYMGYPTDEIDKRWEDLYSFGISQISKSEAAKLTNKTLPRPGSQDYLIEIDVFHQLHCLNDLRKAFYPDRYPGKWPYRDGEIDYKSVTFMHWDHCIDALRQTIMCHGDVSVLPFHINPINQNLVPELATRHTCRNFEKIQDWARVRQADEYETITKPGRRPGRAM